MQDAQNLSAQILIAARADGVKRVQHCCDQSKFDNRFRSLFFSLDAKSDLLQNEHHAAFSRPVQEGCRRHLHKGDLPVSAPKLEHLRGQAALRMDCNAEQIREPLAVRLGEKPNERLSRHFLLGNAKNLTSFAIQSEGL